MQNYETTATEGLLDKIQAAARLRVSPRTIDNRIKDGAIPYIKLGKLIRFIPADLERFIQSHRVK